MDERRVLGFGPSPDTGDWPGATAQFNWESTRSRALFPCSAICKKRLEGNSTKLKISGSLNKVVNIGENGKIIFLDSNGGIGGKFEIFF